MLSRTRERLANEAATWRHLGLIDDALAQTLAERYDARGSAMQMALRWLGFFAIFMLAAALLGFVGIVAAQASMMVPAVLLAGLSGGAWVAGARLARDAHGRYPIVGSALLTVALVGAYGTLSLLYLVGGGDRYDHVFPLLMLLTAAAAVATAYAYRQRWPLLLGLLLLFHAAGSWHAYGGYGGYFARLQDERLMALLALGVVVLGWWHEQRAERDLLPLHVGFGGLYLVTGLVYLNGALWFLTLPRGGLMAVLLFAAAAIGQIVVGAALKDSRFTGFGVVFLGINLYTRFFEHFWDRLSAGAFFALAGLIAVGAGVLCERAALARREDAV